MKSKKLLDSFTKFCNQHPELRFWQSLLAWSGQQKIWVEHKEEEIIDTFYSNKKTGL
jgi:hypothetical protein